MGSSDSWINERVILGTSSKLYKVVEKEFYLSPRQECTLPPCILGLGIYLRLDRPDGWLNHHSRVRGNLPHVLDQFLKLLSFRFDMTEGYHLKTFLCSALFGSYSSSAQVIEGSVHYGYKHRHPSCESPLTSWTVNLTRCLQFRNCR